MTAPRPNPWPLKGTRGVPPPPPAPPPPARDGLSREAALEAFFAEMRDWFSVNDFDGSAGEGKVGTYFNNEYFVSFPLDVVRVLWPEWKP